jgi:hypothetical protein
MPSVYIVELQGTAINIKDTVDIRHLLSYTACPSLLLTFPHYVTTSTIFGKGFIEQKSVFFNFLHVCQKNFLFREEFVEMTSLKHTGLCVKYILMKSEVFFDRFSENPSSS